MTKSTLQKPSKKSKPKTLTQTRLKELLHYNPETGIFTWNKNRGNQTKAGSIAGGINNKGYIQIHINQKLYKTNRLAWLYMKGYFPEHEVDHINRIKTDNRWKNLRHISHKCNSRNAKICCNNKSTITGIYKHGQTNKWASQIGIDGKNIHLGLFDNFINAVKARWVAEKENGFLNCNTTSSAYLYLKKHGEL